MRKYLEVFRLSFKMQMIWRFDVAMTIVATFGRILAAWILWRAIFEGRETVSGFTFQGMLSYYMIGSFVASLDMSSQISGEVSELIRAGRFSGHMVTPMNPFGFFGSMIAGESVFHLGFSLVTAFLCMLAFQIRFILAMNIVQTLLSVLMVVIGLIFMAGLQFLIGIFAFKFQDISFFMHLQPVIIGFATGAMVPLSLLPESVLACLRLLPFPYVLYMPAMLLTGQSSLLEGMSGFGILSIWTVFIVLTGQWMYNHLRRKYDGVGI